MAIAWPVLTDDYIEEKATSFRDTALRHLQLENEGPVPVEQIAEQYLGYDLDFVEDDGALPGDVIGGIDFDTNTITINSAIESHLGRYSFTIAHETAHHVLHKDLFLKARSGASIMCRGGKKRPIEEVQADRFAEALLMPKERVIEASYSLQTSRPLFRKSRIVLAARVIKASGLTNVSVSAMDMRLQHLNLSTKSGWAREFMLYVIKQSLSKNKFWDR
ncbi:MAG: ImmA/IrrE family metallo-endopeptidase [Porticoccaceae bacterium]|jgi:Zn-dependent peptidase ImmA (M78 family)